MLSKLLPISFIIAGILVLSQVVLPLVNFKISEQVFAASGQPLVSPDQSDQSNVLGISIQNTDEFPAIVSTLSRTTKPSYQKFYISIPSANILDAEVAVDSNDFSETLAQLPGSALPGEKGNIFISGHSALPLALLLPGVNNKNKLPFAKLPNVQKGADIFVKVGGLQYRYQVVELKMVKPTDISVINPPDNIGRYISLMTCVPPGFNIERLIVLGKLI